VYFSGMTGSHVFIYFFWQKWGITLALLLGNYLGLYDRVVGIYHGPRHDEWASEGVI
jgi:hypothetical protein